MLKSGYSEQWQILETQEGKNRIIGYIKDV